jgi:Flp pilus assembly protein TadG
MSRFLQINLERVKRFKNSEDGTTMVEFAICISLFLLILFAVIDFGRLGYQWVVAEKAMQKAVRIATVRPPVCSGVPSFHLRQDPSDITYNTGTLCRDVSGLCNTTSTPACLLSGPTTGDALTTADEIWATLSVLLPPGTSKSNILMSYEYDARLGFLGGPYIPIVTAELVGSFSAGVKTDLMFDFVTPLSALAAVAGSANAATMLPDGSGCTGCIPFPRVSVTIPGEDLNKGVEG